MYIGQDKNKDEISCEKYSIAAGLWLINFIYLNKKIALTEFIPKSKLE